jgi:hypothetical protein
MTYIFDAAAGATARAELQAEVMAAGYVITNQAKFDKAAAKDVRKAMYSCWSNANKLFTYREEKLAEVAPTNPTEVAALVRDHWANTFWPARKAKRAKDLAKLLRLKKS